MSTITRETVERYARLANLEFSDEEAEMMVGQLGDMLDYVEKISELDLGDVEATDHIIDLAIPKREDQPQPSFVDGQALRNAPDTESDHFLVPKVISRS